MHIVKTCYNFSTYAKMMLIQMNLSTLLYSSEGGLKMTIYCMHCGTQLPDVASFCYKCGKPLEAASSARTIPQGKQTSYIETCEIICKSGGFLGMKSSFVARAIGANGRFIAAKSSKTFRSNVGGTDGSGNEWHRPDTYSWGSKPLAEAAFDEIVSMLSQDGWQPDTTGREWWQCKFKRQKI